MSKCHNTHFIRARSWLTDLLQHTQRDWKPPRQQVWIPQPNGWTMVAQGEDVAPAGNCRCWNPPWWPVLGSVPLERCARADLFPLTFPKAEWLKSVLFTFSFSLKLCVSPAYWMKSQPKEGRVGGRARELCGSLGITEIRFYPILGKGRLLSRAVPEALSLRSIPVLSDFSVVNLLWFLSKPS